MTHIFTTIIGVFLSLATISPISSNANLGNIYSYNGVASASNSSEKPLIITRILSDSEIKSKKPLIAKEIFDLTNAQRVKQGLSPLAWNETLANISNAKTQDMITNKYFAHESPDGTSVTDLAARYKYNYSLVGENLAMGDFLNSADVVDGWMQSPGHRANILKPTYTEIGITAMVGIVDGNYVWFSVQEFGRPSPLCEKPNANTEAIIKSGTVKMEIIEKAMSSLKQGIESSLSAGTASGLKTIIDGYNNLVTLTNSLYKMFASTVADYNESVKRYNDCIQKENAIINTK